MSPDRADLPGYDVVAVEAWVADHTDELLPPFEWIRCEGGHSNLTYELRDAEGHRAVIRRPPEGELLPKAHDMSREHRVISALWDTPVPVARPHAFCADESVTGAPFYVMGFVDGKALYTVDDVEAWVAESDRATIGESIVDAMAALHAVDPAAVGLGDLGRPDGYVARQLRTWYGSWNSSKEANGIDVPEIHRLHDVLTARLPDQGPPCVVHGDLGPHNSMVDRRGRVTAIVDWEISTLGDPLADLAYLLNMWASPDDVPTPRPEVPSLARGMVRREALADRYTELTGRDLSGLDVYVAFNHFKSACIVHGVHARYVNGQKAIDPADLADLRERVDLTIERARRALAELES